MSWTPFGPQRAIAFRVHFGGRHLLIVAFTRVEEGKQGVAEVVDIKAVILSGTIAQIGDQGAVVRELLDASCIQPLEYTP